MNNTIHYTHHNSQTPLTEGTWMLNAITPNLRKRHKISSSLSIFFGVMIPVCFALFAVVGSTLPVQMSNPILALLPIMFAFMASGVLVGFFSVRTARIKVLLNVITEVESKDKTVISSLYIALKCGPNFAFLIVKKLIETGNLPNYRLVGEVGVVKKGVEANESDFVSPSPSQTTTASTSSPRPSKCPNCGASTKDNKFCPFCGTKF